MLDDFSLENNLLYFYPEFCLIQYTWHKIKKSFLKKKTQVDCKYP